MTTIASGACWINARKRLSLSRTACSPACVRWRCHVLGHKGQHPLLLVAVTDVLAVALYHHGPKAEFRTSRAHPASQSKVYPQVQFCRYGAIDRTSQATQAGLSCTQHIFREPLPIFRVPASDMLVRKIGEAQDLFLGVNQGNVKILGVKQPPDDVVDGRIEGWQVLGVTGLLGDSVEAFCRRALACRWYSAAGAQNKNCNGRSDRSFDSSMYRAGVPCANISTRTGPTRKKADKPAWHDASARRVRTAVRRSSSARRRCQGPTKRRAGR